MKLELAQRNLVCEFLLESLKSKTNADPVILSQYVIELIKEEKDIASIERECLVQLKDFLKANTALFVQDMVAYLRDVLATKPAAKPAPETVADATPQVQAAVAPGSRMLPGAKRPREEGAGGGQGKEPRVEGGRGRGRGRGADSGRGAGAGRGRGGSGGTGRIPAKEEPSTTFVRVDGLNPGNNVWSKLMGFFKQFGFIRCIVSDQERGSAYVVYSEHDEALTAIRAPQAYDNNRFVKVVLIYDDEAPPLVHEALGQAMVLLEEKQKKAEEERKRLAEEERVRIESMKDEIEAQKKALEDIRAKRTEMIAMQTAMMDQIKSGALSGEAKEAAVKQLSWLLGQVQECMQAEKVMIASVLTGPGNGRGRGRGRGAAHAGAELPFADDAADAEAAAQAP